MLPINVKALLDAREIESSRIEYKRKWNQAECIRTICAFANDIENQDGGYILIGVEEKNGRPVLPVSGIDPEEIDKIERKLQNSKTASEYESLYNFIDKARTAHKETDGIL